MEQLYYFPSSKLIWKSDVTWRGREYQSQHTTLYSWSIFRFWTDVSMAYLQEKYIVYTCANVRAKLLQCKCKWHWSPCDQVKTRLQHPTQYHIKQKQQEAVKMFFKDSDDCRMPAHSMPNLALPSVDSQWISGSAPSDVEGATAGLEEVRYWWYFLSIHTAKTVRQWMRCTVCINEITMVSVLRALDSLGWWTPLTPPIANSTPRPHFLKKRKEAKCMSLCFSVSDI